MSFGLKFRVWVLSSVRGLNDGLIRQYAGNREREREISKMD